MSRRFCVFLFLLSCKVSLRDKKSRS